MAGNYTATFANFSDRVTLNAISNDNLDLEGNAGADVNVTGIADITVSGSTTLQSVFTFGTTITTITNAVGQTYTISQLLGGQIQRDLNGGGDLDDTLPTAANIVAGINNPVVGTTLVFTIDNISAADETLTLLGNTGTTLAGSGPFTIVQDETRTFKAIVTAIGADAVEIYSIDSNGAGAVTGAAGVTTDIQWNNAGAFAAATLSTFQFTDNAIAPQMDIGAEDANFTIKGVDATVAGGGDGNTITIEAGNGDGAGVGGSLAFNAGEGGATADGGEIEFNAGGGDAFGGGIYIYSGGSNGANGDGGPIELSTENGVGTGSGGEIAIETGGATGGDGGNIRLTAGISTGGGTDGLITLAQSGYSAEWPIDTPVAGEVLSVQTFVGSTATLEWAAGGGAPGGADTEIQFNNMGAFDGSANLTWDYTNNILGVSGNITQDVISQPVELGNLTDVTNLNQVRALELSGNLLYFGTTAGDLIGVIDVVDPTTPVLISTLTPAGTWSGVPSLALQGNYLYGCSATGSDLYVFDVSDPSNITTVGTLSFGLTPLGIAVSGSYVYIASNGNNSVYSIDISDPTTPVQTDSITDGTNLSGVTSIYLQGIYLYAGSLGTFVTIDISDPTAMVVTDVLTDATNLPLVRGIVVRSNYAYVMVSDRFVVIDVADKTAAAIVGNLSDTQFTSASTIALTGNYAYTTDVTGDLIVVVDISDPTTPTIVVTHTTAYTQPIILRTHGRYLYAGFNTGDTIAVYDIHGTEITSVQAGNIRTTSLAVDNNAQIGGTLSVQSGAQINNSLAVLSNFSVNGPSQFHSNITQDITRDPVVVGTITDATNIDGPEVIAVQGDYLYYLTSGTDAIGVLDISVPSNPTIVSTLAVTDMFYILVSGTYLYAGGAGFNVYNISDPSNITVVGSIASSIIAGAVSIDISGSIVFVLDPNNTGLDGIGSIDISDPTNPVLLDTLSDGVTSTSSLMTVDGNWLYASSSGSSFAVYDVADPYNMVQISTLALSRLPVRIIVSGNYAYLSNVLAGGINIFIIDVSDKTAMTTTASLTDNAALDTGTIFMDLSGNYLFTGSSTNNLLSIVDVSDPSVPFVLNSISFTNPAACVVNGRYLYAAGTSTDTITIYDIHGSEFTSVQAGNIGIADNLQVGRDTNIIGQLTVGSGAQISNGLGVTGVFGVSAESQFQSNVTVNGPSQFNNNITQDITLDPVEIGTLTDATNLNAAAFIAVQGDLLVYLTNGGILGFVDITIPTTPTLINNVTITGTFSSASSLIVRGKYAYATSVTGDDLYIFDISDPSNITAGGDGTIQDATNLNGARSVDVSGSYAYVVSALNNSISSVDISDPTTPTITDTLVDATNLNGAFHLMIQGKYAYAVATSSSAFNIIDISDPTNLSITDTLIDATNLATAVRVFVQGLYAYVTSDDTTDRLLVIDISDKTAAAIVGNVTDATYINGPYGLWVAGNYVYLNSSDNDNVSVWDVSDPTSPTFVSGDTPGASLDQPGGLIVQGRYLYTCGLQSDSVNIFDIHGTELTNVDAGNIRTSELTVRGNTQILGALNVSTSCQINNSLAVMSHMTCHQDFHLRGEFYPNSITVKDKTILYIKENRKEPLVINTKTFVGIINIALETGLECVFRVTNPFVTPTSNVMLSLVGKSGEVRVINIQQGYYEAWALTGDGICKIQYLIL